MAVYDFFLSRNASAVSIADYVGHKGRLFYDDTGTTGLRISDGLTPGGLPFTAAGIATESSPGIVQPGQGLAVDTLGILSVKNGNGLRFDESNNLALAPATSDTLGGIKLGPGVVLNDQDQIIIDTEGLDFSFGDFSATTQPGPDSTDAAYLSSINENEAVVIASNGTGSINVVGEFNIYAPNGSIADRDPVFNIDNEGGVFSTTLNITNADDLDLEAPLTVTINQDGLTKTPAVVTGSVAQFTGRDDRTAIMVLDSYGVDTDRGITGGEFVFRTGRGTNASPLAVQTDDILGAVTGAGWGDTGYGGVGAASLYIKAAEDFTDTERGGKLELHVIPQGTATSEKIITVDENGLSVDHDDAGISNTAYVAFDTAHGYTGSAEGTVSWNTTHNTLDIYHAAGVVQQVGQETYMDAVNNTGSLIPNGSVVRFTGADTADGFKIEVALQQGDGTFPNIYTIGVTSQDIPDGESGKITTFGAVRNIDVSGYSLGDILYSDPTVPGGFTNVKPTAPNNVIPIAAVLNPSTAEDGGEIFVRPTLDQRLDYGVFTRGTDFAFAAANTAYVVELTTTEVASEIELGTPASRVVADQSGLYQVEWNIHWSTAGGTFDEDQWFTWLRKNGVDVPNTMRRGSIDGEVDDLSYFTARTISLDAGDYIEIAVAVSSTDISLDAVAATGFGPATAALEVSVAQIQL